MPELLDLLFAADEPDGANAAGTAKFKKSKDMDDLILFSNCNPFANIWKLYADNIELASNFKITKETRQECVDAVPECFKVSRKEKLY